MCATGSAQRNGKSRARAERNGNARGRGVTRANTGKFYGATSVRGKIIAISERDGRGSGGALARLRAVSSARAARKGGRDGDREIQLKILRVTRRENVQLPFKGLRDRSIQPPCVHAYACACICAFEAAKTMGKVRACCPQRIARVSRSWLSSSSEWLRSIRIQYPQYSKSRTTRVRDGENVAE